MDLERQPWEAANKAKWEERVPLHLDSDFYDVEGFRSGHPQLQPYEVDELGALDACRVLHLQCHFGLDTLDLVRLHPTIQAVGLDFSPRAVAAANRLANELGLGDRAQFIVANVYDAVDTVGPGTFDLVYSGKGALNWLPDMARWARVVHDLLRPGGQLYLTEFHPASQVFGADAHLPVEDYFRTEPIIDEEPGTYADPEAVTEANLSYEWQHPIDQVLDAILSAGLPLRFFHEWDFTLFHQYPWLVAGADGRWRWPGSGSLPLMYSLKAQRPAAAS